jgi:Icc-related predicted phosphoesterase
VKILFTADLHMSRATRETILERLDEWVRRFEPGALVVAGDLSTAGQAEEIFAGLRTCFRNGPIAVCLGNHDFWLRDSVRSEFRTLDEVIERCWEPSATRYDITLLEVASMLLEDVALVGGYGHYDLGFRVPRLAYDGISVRNEHYFSGTPPAESFLRWRDFQFMPAGLDLFAVADGQVEGVRSRLKASATARNIVVLHTPPMEELLGIPGLPERPLDDSPSLYAFFRAYLGNKGMGEMLDGFRDRILSVVCGHTHRVAGPLELNGCIGVNIGSDYGDPKGALYDTCSNGWRRI